MRMPRSLFVLLAAAASLLAALPFACARKIDPAYVQRIDAWHAERIAGLRGETGWLTLVGLHPLRAGINRIGSAEGMDVRLTDRAPASVGVLTVAGDSLVLQVDPGVDARVQGTAQSRAGARIVMATDAAGQPTVVELGSLLWYAIQRGERRFLRVKDRDSEVRRTFAGIDRFPVDPRWRVTARLEKHEPPLKIVVPDVLGGMNEETSPGTLVFRVGGRECRLMPTGEPGEPLFIVFGDRTNGRATYGGGRFLSADAPAADGTVTLDFNQAVNPPCAFTPFATCPLPPEGNRLPVAIEAGEKTWGTGHH